MHLALRVVETPGAGPTIGTAEHGASAMFGFDPRQFTTEEIEHLVPGTRDEFLIEATLGARAAVAA